MQKNKIKNQGLSVARLPSSIGYPNLKILWFDFKEHKYWAQTLFNY
jgi:hypothetical protein